ncbi:MAG: hypothetical protein QOJ56_5798 [Mycobacterium sp.]|jgi:hypothetical protein|nr:hypothetical protein [Mycobacterium sp.]
MDRAVHPIPELLDSQRPTCTQTGWPRSGHGNCVTRRGVTDVVAALAAELGLLAFKEAYAIWVAADNQQGLAELARTALDQLRTTIAELS